ncbi:hypothetical protein [Streptomyces coelicoflavus]|uniref:hypothetical protein n=1 Tax=Streptomyces coelicoflavus TaxID=285562 RepID=UPI002E26EE84
MTTTLWRALLDPLTSLRAALERQRGGPAMTYEHAWRRTRLLRHPDDMVYQLHRHHAEADGGADEGRTNRG